MKIYERWICDITHRGKDKDVIWSKSSSASGRSSKKKVERQAVTMTYECQKKSKMTKQIN
jgi:hypothetical protein